MHGDMHESSVMSAYLHMYMYLYMYGSSYWWGRVEFVY